LGEVALGYAWAGESIAFYSGKRGYPPVLASSVEISLSRIARVCLYLLIQCKRYNKSNKLIK